MKHIIPPRANMPTISNAAHRTLSTRPEYNNPGDKHPFKTPDLKDQEKTLEFCHNEKLIILPKLKELKQILNDANVAYSIAYDNWNKLATSYERLDRQEKILLHQQKIATNVKKSPTRKSKSTEESSAKLAMKILAALSPEKQAEILALIKQQGELNNG